MYLSDDGMYRIDKSDFTNAGINVNNIDPRSVKVFNKGNQIPIYFLGEQDGVFNDLDYFDFFGSRNYGGLTNTYDQNNALIYVTNEFYNQYSDTNLYWIEWDGGNGLRFNNSVNTTSNLYPLNYFFETLHLEKDKVYSQGENIGSNDLRFLNTEKFKGESWYWSQLRNGQTVNDTFTIPSKVGSQSASIRIHAYPQNRNTSISNEHNLEISINGTIISSIFSNDFGRIDTIINFSSSLLTNSSQNNVTAKYNATPGFDGSMYFDLFEINYPRLFKFQNSKISVNLNSTDTTSKLFRISGYNASNPINIFDVKNNIRITNITSNLDTLKFTGKGNARFEIVNSNIVKKPFKIKQRQVPNLVSGSNGVDYLVIYHSLLQSQAEQLRSYRASQDNFRSVKTEIEDIYDIFNFGLEDPVAVRNFVKYIYDNWQQPKIQFICLLGRGSLDPKKNSSASAFHQNLIPVYGNPPSDGYFANLNIGSFFYHDQISIGRLPAYYPSEAQTMIDKIIAYENEPPSQWWKTFTFITGGGTLPEQQLHQTKSNFDVNGYIIPCPIAGEDHKIYRSDNSGSTTFNFADSIKNDINRGTLFVNYRGHAGSRNWEVGMQDPNVLSNGNKLPVVLSLTCFTGESSKGDFRGFGEKFIYLNGKGAIGFVGTTGWSYVNEGNNLGTHILQAMKLDSSRRIGEFLKIAGSRMSIDSLSFSVRHTINCYKLLGDPAVKIKLPRIPEFVITNEDYMLSNETPEVNELISLKIYPKNFGLCADSIKIRFQLRRNNQNYSYRDTVYKNFKNLDTILYNFQIDSLTGVHSMFVKLDQDNWYPFENKDNNFITINLPFKGNAFVPISPVNNSIVVKDSIEFKGLNPTISLHQNSVRVILQLDTSKLFNSPVQRTFVNNNPSGAVTKFFTNLPLLISNKLFYWRTNSIINNDTSGWSKTQVFVYVNGSTARSHAVEDQYINSSINVNLSKAHKDQFSPFDFNNTTADNGGIMLNQYTANLFIRSYGSNAEESSYFSVGDKNVYIDGGRNAGLNMLKVKKLNGNILEFKNLRMISAASSDSLVNFLNTFDQNHYLMLLNAAYFAGGTTLSSSAKNKLREFGSIYCDSIGLLSYFHSWSFIGSLGASQSQVSEMFDPCCRPAPGCVACDHWGEAFSNMNVVFRKTSGTVTNRVGPAQTWTSFSWTRSLVPNSSLSFDVYGIDRMGVQSLLLTNVQTENFVDISSINAYQYPYLNLLAKFNMDSILGSQSPVLHFLNIKYVPASELILEKNTLQTNSSGENKSLINFSFDYHNGGYVYLPGIIVNVYGSSVSDSNLILTDTVSSILKYDSTKNYSNNIQTPNFRDSLRIYIHIKPKGNYNEFYTYNNTVDFNVNTSSVDIPLKLEAFSDGQLLHDKDFVRKNPEIRINVMKSLTDALISDTTQLSLNINNIYVPYFINGSLNQSLKFVTNDNNGLLNSNVSLYYFPEFENGSNKLSIVYKNESDNLDTVMYEVFVSDKLMIMDFYNYPNPMRDVTQFIINLAGSDSPDRSIIKIYTVSGRLIKEINIPMTIGYNSFSWDGRDNDGDYLANGTYLYKLVTQGGSNTESQAQKLVVLK